jgi:pimeloyl-ACP methyl ester carboxylesterase
VSEWGDLDRAGTVFLGAHGYLDCGDVFAPVVAELRLRNADVFFAALTFAGHGNSDRADSYGWFDHVADVLAFVEPYRGRGSTTVAVGHSFGGIQMLEALTMEPRGIDLFVNLDAVSDPGSPEAARLGEALADRSRADRRTLGTYPDREALVERRKQYNPRLSRETLRPLVAALSHPTGAGYTWKVDPALVGWVRPWDLTLEPSAQPLELTASLSIPVLTVTGAAEDHPRIRGRYPGDEAVARSGSGEHLALPGAGHYVHLEEPAAVAEAMLKAAATLARSERD